MMLRNPNGDSLSCAHTSIRTVRSGSALHATDVCPPVDIVTIVTTARYNTKSGVIEILNRVLLNYMPVYTIYYYQY